MATGGSPSLRWPAIDVSSCVAGGDGWAWGGLPNGSLPHGLPCKKQNSNLSPTTHQGGIIFRKVGLHGRLRPSLLYAHSGLQKVPNPFSRQEGGGSSAAQHAQHVQQAQAWPPFLESP